MINLKIKSLMKMFNSNKINMKENYYQQFL